MFPLDYSRRIQELLRKAKQGRPLRDSDGLPVHAIGLRYPEGLTGPRVWIEHWYRASRRKAVSPSGPPGTVAPASHEDTDETTAPVEPVQTVPIICARGPLPKGTVLVETGPLVSVDTSEEPTRSFAAVQSGGPPLEPEAGQSRAVGVVVGASSYRSPGGGSQTSSSLGRAFGAGLGMAACLAMFALASGCLLTHRAPGGSDQMSAEEPDRVPGKFYTENATDKNGNMGTARKHSIPMPDKPYSWQKVAPCAPGEREKVGGCWIHSDDPPPCSRAAVESAGECYVPVPAEPKPTNTVTPEQK